MTAGRRRAFEKETALESAMKVFWQNGYAGTSLADLTQAMGINKPSLYSAFGNKEQLFMTALQHYVGLNGTVQFERMTAPNRPFSERIRDYLQLVAQMFSQPDMPAGCLLANSTGELASDVLPSSAHNLVETINEKRKQQWIEFFAQEQASGAISSATAPGALALYLMTIVAGMAVMARNGATLAELNEMIAHIVETFV